MKCARCGAELHVSDELGTLADANDEIFCAASQLPHAAGGWRGGLDFNALERRAWGQRVSAAGLRSFS
jgi:hypothetical protein